MLREKLDSINDGDTLKNGVLFSVFFLTAMLFSLETTGFRFSFAVVFLAASAVQYPVVDPVDGRVCSALTVDSDCQSISRNVK